MNNALPKTLAPKIGEATAPDQNPLAMALVGMALRETSPEIPLSLRLAASFDLVVASKFYQYVKPEAWLWCGHAERDFYTYLNACPACTLQGRFVHQPGHKPGSGQIGPTTALAFREVVSAYFHQTGKNDCRVHNASEPIDLAVVDEARRVVFLAEVKAAPLFTPPVCRTHSASSMQTGATLAHNHTVGISRNLHLAECALFIPSPDGPFEIQVEAGSIGQDRPLDLALADSLAREPSIALRYFRAWAAMWGAYGEKRAEDPVFWFTGACGRPPSPGDGWPREASGKLKGSISDGKTSVGLDRTDDIKKATFQALKLGVENRRTDTGNWTLLIGLASNVHAARHYEGYLKPYEDIIWGWGEDRAAGDLYNLFDGIVSFTRSHMRHEWLRQVLDWQEEDHA